MRDVKHYSLGWLLGALLGLAVGCTITPKVLSPDKPQSQDTRIVGTDNDVIQNQVEVLQTYVWGLGVVVVGSQVLNLLGDWLLLRTLRRQNGREGFVGVRKRG